MISKLYRTWNRLSWMGAGEALLVAFGTLWLIVEILVFFNEQAFAEKIRSVWWLFTLLGVAYAIIKNWPKSSYSFEVKNRDASIAINISDIFELDGAKIVPINNRLDTSLKGAVERSSSILNFFINKVYSKNNQHLGTDISNQLEDNSEFYDSLVINNDPKEYKIGTVVPIFQDEKQYYLLCNASLNQQGRSKCSPDDLRNSLVELWAYLIHSGSKEHLIIPVLGTGRGRITMTREEVIKEIVLSFLVSLSNDNYCDKLTICIHPEDMKKYKLNIDGIVDFVRLNCDNANFAQNAGQPAGQQVE
jgi:Thoeris protein ThsA, Macro domain